MPWQMRIWSMIGRPVGVSLSNGQGTSGVLCGVGGNVIYLLEYMYQQQFALKQYSYSMISDVNPFPPCQQNPNRLY